MHNHPADPVIVGCGALVRELRVVFDQLGITEPITRWLPANLHNRPEQIPAAVTAMLDELADTTGANVATDIDEIDDRAAAASSRPVLVAYADCGTGGLLDAALADYPGTQRLPGAHCYEFFAGADAFAALSALELGTFYLTDYLALHFDALVWAGLGLDTHPELRDLYFGNYRRLVWLSQTDNPRTETAARAAADRLGLQYEKHPTGLGPVAEAVSLATRSTSREQCAPTEPNAPTGELSGAQP